MEINVKEFSLEIFPDRKNELGYGIGKIIIGDFKETVLFDLNYWDTERYKSQWCKAVDDILSGRENKTCLFTSVRLEENYKVCAVWDLFRQGDLIYIHSCGFNIDEITNFSFEHPSQFMDDWESPDKREFRISEWVIPVQSIERWFLKLCS